MSETNTTLSDLPRALVKRVPELKDAMELEASYWAEIGVSPLGPDTAFDRVVAPYVIARLRDDESGRDEVLQRIFAFLEDLAASDDDLKLSVVSVSFGEAFLDDLDAWEQARGYIGPRLNECLNFMQRWVKKPRWRQRLGRALRQVARRFTGGASSAF